MGRRDSPHAVSYLVDDQSVNPEATMTPSVVAYATCLLVPALVRPKEGSRAPTGPKRMGRPRDPVPVSKTAPKTPDAVS